MAMGRGARVTVGRLWRMSHSLGKSDLEARHTFVAFCSAVGAAGVSRRPFAPGRLERQSAAACEGTAVSFLLPPLQPRSLMWRTVYTKVQNMEPQNNISWPPCTSAAGAGAALGAVASARAGGSSE